MKPFLHQLQKNWKQLSVGAAAGIGICLIAYISSGESAYFQKKIAQDNCRNKDPLTSRSLDCVTLDSNTDNIRSLDALLETTAALYINEGRATRVSIAVRDQISQQFAGSNENDTFTPASLMKVPLMIAYYKISELDPAVLSVLITYTQAPTQPNYDNSQDFPPADKLVPGKTYTVEQLIEHMIIDSDNDATNLLFAHINQDIFQQTLVDLGIEIPVNQSTVDFVTAKTYAGVFRTLFNASYLNRDLSQKALALMGKSVFKGIATPIPSSVIVSHKFGEREITGQNGAPVTLQLHDCGIVYKYPHPYSICIMTEGSNFNDLLSIITNLSDIVYQNM